MKFRITNAGEKKTTIMKLTIKPNLKRASVWKSLLTFGVKRCMNRDKEKRELIGSQCTRCGWAW